MLNLLKWLEIAKNVTENWTLHQFLSCHSLFWRIGERKEQIFDNCRQNVMIWFFCGHFSLVHELRYSATILAELAAISSYNVGHSN